MIAFARPDLSELEERYLLEAFRSGWISSTGAFVERFEREFAAFAGTRAAISVGNGTVALHLALLALDVRPGDEVLVPALTYVATANAVRYVGAEPVFVDVDPETWCLDARLIESAVSRRTRGIIAVHLYGHPADMDAIERVAAAHGLWVIEDAAQAHGARYKGRPAGSLARAGTFSFYGNKIFSCGEGGAVTVDDPQLEARMRLLRGQGMDPQRRYWFPVMGYNFRLTNLACAILCAQLERKQEILTRRKRIFGWYRELLGDVAGIGLPPAALWAEPAPWVFSITVNEGVFGCTRDELAAKLSAEGIETRPFFVPLHRLPFYRRESAARGDCLPVSERLARRGLSLPVHDGIGPGEVEAVARAIRSSARAVRRLVLAGAGKDEALAHRG